jgi:hypothetical protein
MIILITTIIFTITQSITIAISSMIHITISA